MLPDALLDGLDPVSYGASRDDDATPSTGEVMAIYLDQAHVGIGAGRALFTQALVALRDAGHRRVTVWVLDANDRARRFYEAAGMRLDGATMHQNLGGFSVTEVRYDISL